MTLIHTSGGTTSSSISIYVSLNSTCAPAAIRLISKSQAVIGLAACSAMVIHVGDLETVLVSNVELFPYIPLTDFTSTDYVNNNPSAFSEAYFDFEWLKIYS